MIECCQASSTANHDVRTQRRYAPEVTAVVFGDSGSGRVRCDEGSSSSSSSLSCSAVSATSCRLRSCLSLSGFHRRPARRSFELRLRAHLTGMHAMPGVRGDRERRVRARVPRPRRSAGRRTAPTTCPAVTSTSRRGRDVIALEPPTRFLPTRLRRSLSRLRKGPERRAARAHGARAGPALGRARRASGPSRPRRRALVPLTLSGSPYAPERAGIPRCPPAPDLRPVGLHEELHAVPPGPWKFAFGASWYVTQPSVVAICRSPPLVTRGVERTKTSASRTTKPRVSLTRTRP